MGQFLSIGICTNILISKKKLESKGFSLEDALMELSKKFNVDVFDYVESNNEYHQWKINESLFKSEIEDFLTKIYNDYGDANITLIDKISSFQTFENILAFAENKSHENFQIDKYSNPEYIELGKFSEYIDVHTTYIGLFFAGKIFMECYGKMFSFFRNNMRQVYTKYKLSGALNVYITG